MEDSHYAPYQEISSHPLEERPLGAIRLDSVRPGFGSPEPFPVFHQCEAANLASGDRRRLLLRLQRGYLVSGCHLVCRPVQD